MSQCNQCRQTQCECMDPHNMTPTLDAADLMAREILRLDAAATPAPWAKGDGMDGVLVATYRNLAPPLAAAYLDLRAQLDAAQTRIVALEAEKHRMYEEHSRLVRVANDEAHENAVWWRSQVDTVTAQRDELREAADDYRSAVSNAYSADSFGKRKRALERLTKALEAAR